MEKVWIIANKEVKTFFDSLIAYIILIIFLGLCGFLTWGVFDVSLFGVDVFLRKQADLAAFFWWAKYMLFLIIPALTMRQFSEEFNSGTIELLLTKPLSNFQLVVGKWLGCMVMVIVALLFTLPYYITVASIGPIDHGATISGYIGLLMLSGAFVSIGVFASTLTKNQIVAFLVALFINFILIILLDSSGRFLTGWLGQFLEIFNMADHFDSISRGVIDSKDVLYFCSVIFLGLVLAEWNISKN